LLLSGALLAGCQSTLPDLAPDEPGYAPPPLVRGPAPLPFAHVHPLRSYTRLQYLSCEYTAHFPSNSKASSSFPANKAVAAIAAANVEFAMMANNAYRDAKGNPLFLIPSWTADTPMQTWKNDRSGFMLDHYERMGADGKKEIAIAFRGTDGLTDIPDMRNNFSIYLEPDQYYEARNYVDRLRNLPDNRDARITVVGHSLGGALAINVSYQFPGVDAVAFNTSPRGFYDPNRELKNKRTLISEQGEFLALPRVIWFRKLRGIDHHEFNFLKFSYPLIANFQNHKVYDLTRGLLLYAQQTEPKDMKQLFNVNLGPIDYQRLLAESRDPARDKSSCEQLTAAP
jgi:pimeloyl-ACP methyl ester carboxylesterase